MAKMQVLQHGTQYQQMKTEAYELQEWNDCAVKAVALVCNVSYKKAHNVMKQLGRKDRKGTNFYAITKPAIELLGKKLIEIDPQIMINKYPERYRNKQYVTTRHPVRFPKVWKNGETYLFGTKRHITAVVNGRVEDWAVNNAKRVIRLHLVKDA